MDFSNIKRIMDKVSEERIPGCCIVGYKDGKRVLEYSTGYASLEAKEPMSTDKLFNIYSSSKVATCTAAMQLYERGFFLLDTPVYEFIPEFKDIKVKDGDSWRDPMRPVTMRSLFTMSSGMTYNLNTPNVQAVREKTNGAMPTLEVIRALVKDGLTFDPGEPKFQYSLSHDVLAGVVEVISGMKFRDYMKKYIFEPLEMSTAVLHNENIRDLMAEQYSYCGENAGPKYIEQAEKYAIKRPHGYNFNIAKGILSELYPGPEYDCGGAGITVSCPDFAKFTAALSRGGLGINGERILSSGTAHLMMTSQIQGEWAKRFDPKGGYGYGLGAKVCIGKAGSGTNSMVGEFGWPGAGGAFMLINPNERVSFFFTEHMIDGQGKYFEEQIKHAFYAGLQY